MPKINHIRIYPGVESGFDILLLVRGGMMKHGSYPDIATAIAAAWALEGRKPGDPIYVYGRDFSSSLAGHIVAKCFPHLTDENDTRGASGA